MLGSPNLSSRDELMDKIFEGLSSLECSVESQLMDHDSYWIHLTNLIRKPKTQLCNPPLGVEVVLCLIVSRANISINTSSHQEVFTS